jgi:putative ABC transport system permease protein
MSPEKSQSPRLAQRLLRIFLREDLAEEVSGDLDEKFYATVRKKGLFRARINFWYQVIQYFRPFAIRKSNSTLTNNSAMFQNYFKIAWRNLAKQRMYSLVKVAGFSLGIASCLLITLFIQDELSFDSQYPDGDRIYRLVEVFESHGEIQRGSWFQAPFANALKADYPEIEKAGRYNSSELFGAGSCELRRTDQAENTYEEGLVYMDQELLEILQIPMVYGNRNHCLDDPRTLVITKRMADKYFPKEDPVGKTVILNNDAANPFRIGGVIENFSETSHLQFDFIRTMKGVEFWQGEQNYWGATNYPTYIKLKPGADPKQLQYKMSRVVEKYMLPMWIADGVPNPKELVRKVYYELQAIRDIHLKSAGIQGPGSYGDIRFVWLFGAVASFILIIACVNFINLSTAKSANRAKEVGLRKTVGSSRRNIVNQFLTESLVFSFLSFGVALLLAQVLLPYFNRLATKSLSFPWADWRIYPILILASIVVGVFAGIYPSFYLSAFKPVNVLKGNLSRGSKSATLRSSLVVFQFTTSIILIIATFIIYRQVNFILNTKVGYDKEQVLLIRGAGTLDKQLTTFKNELLQLSQVKSATISDYLPIAGTKRNGNGYWKAGKKKEEMSTGSQNWKIDHDYLKTMGIKLIAGRDFSTNIRSDSGSVIVNQAFVKEIGLKDPIGARIESWRVWTIVGVVENFNFESLREKVNPLVFEHNEYASIVSVKIKSGDLATTIKNISGIWKKFSPHQPIRYSFLDENYANMYEDVQRMGRIFTTFAVLAIIVACLGLFALSAFMVEQRGKEISIRLVLGASLSSIFSLLTLNFLKLVFISVLLASPMAWYGMKKWLEDYTYKTEITWDVFFFAGIIGAGIALLTISYQSIRAGMVSPVENLKEQ